MNQPSRPPYITLVVGLVLATATLLLLVQVNQRQRAAKKAASPPPSFESPPPILKSVTPFSLTNHLGAPVGLDRLKGRVWVAQIIFTRCPGPCARMTEFFTKLQAKLPANGSVRMVSLTSDPEFDTPEVLARYAGKASANPIIWEFLTGTKRDVVQLAVQGLGLTTLDKEESERTSPEDLFIHSTISVVVDRNGKVRGSIETLEPGAEEQILKWVERLLAEQPSAH